MNTESLPAPPPAGGAALEPEFAANLRELPRLLPEGHAGRYALLKGNEVVGVWDTQCDVLRDGYERFGPEPFSVKKIDARDPERLAALRGSGKAVCPS